MIILLGANYKDGWTAHFAYMALQRMGVKIIPFTPTVDAPPDWIKVAPDLDIVDFYNGLAEKPDAFLMVEASVGTPFFPRGIERLPITTAVWLYDNYLNFRWHKEMAALFDYPFFAQLNRARLAEKYTRRGAFWLPFAADEELHRDANVERDIDIGYVGTITEQKKKYFRQFEASGLEVKTNDRHFSPEEIGRFYSRCKLVYNILARRDLNVRAFEAPSAGAVVVNQGWIDEGSRLIFKDGESMAYHNFSDAPDICRSLLADDAKRRQMGENAKKIVLSAHTYRHRMETVLEKLAGGVTGERMRLRSSFIMPVAEALTCANRDFKWHDRARAKIKEALSRSFLGTISYIALYALWRVWEKVEKTVWSMGRAPV
jgi:hypothetical protein